MKRITLKENIRNLNFGLPFFFFPFFLFALFPFLFFLKHHPFSPPCTVW
jgi:hypothetical protein